METRYLSIAIQYYIAGRSATFAGSIPVAGNLFHHAVEMLLKGFLLDHHSASVLRNDFKHDLRKLWREFKRVSDDSAALAGFDATVSTLDSVEEVRYPGRRYVFATVRRKGPRPRVSGPAARSLKTYYVSLEEIDEFVTDMLRGRVTPGWIRALVAHGDGKAQYGRENLHRFV